MQGKIIKWDQDKGFGFIEPSGGGDDIFIHKTALLNRKRTPQVNDKLEFSISTDKQGRYCAAKARFAGEKKPASSYKKTSPFSIYLSCAFLVALCVAYGLGVVPKLLLFYYLALSLTALVYYFVDKSRAQRGAKRIREKSLHFVSLAGGWPGAAIAQQVLRHKSVKVEFRVVYWATVMVNIGALLWLLSPFGAEALKLLSS